MNRTSVDFASGSDPTVTAPVSEDDTASHETAEPAEVPSAAEVEWFPVDDRGPKFGELVFVKSPGGLELKAKRAHEGWWLREDEFTLMWIPEFWREIPAE